MVETTTDIQPMETGLVPEAPPVEAPAKTRAVDPRQAILDRIAAKQEEVRQTEMERGDVLHREAVESGMGWPEETLDLPPELAQEPTRQVEQPTPPPARSNYQRSESPQPPPSQPTPPPQPQLYPIDLGQGHPVYVTLDQMQHLAKMGAVANQTLHDWNARQQQQFSVPPVDPTPAPAPTPRQVEIDSARVRETVRRMTYGSEDDGTEALTGLIRHVVTSQPAAPSVDTNAIIARARQEALVQMQMQRDAELISNEYPDIVSNPSLKRFAAINVDDVIRENAALGRQMIPLDIYREAGNRVYDALGKPRPGNQAAPQPSAAPQPPSQAAPRLTVVRNDDAAIIERKREAPRQTGQVIDRRTSGPPQQPQKSMSELIDEVRLKRGYPSMR